MKIKTELIGSKVFSKLFNRWIKIEAGQEQLYIDMQLFDVFEKTKPKLIKDAKNSKEFNINNDSDSNGAHNSDSSLLSV